MIVRTPLMLNCNVVPMSCANRAITGSGTNQTDETTCIILIVGVGQHLARAIFMHAFVAQVQFRHRDSDLFAEPPIRVTDVVISREKWRGLERGSGKAERENQENRFHDCMSVCSGGTASLCLAFAARLSIKI